jgi:hypothetical protein
MLVLFFMLFGQYSDGLDGQSHSQQGQDFSLLHNVQTCDGAHPASRPVVIKDWGVLFKFTTN